MKLNLMNGKKNRNNTCPHFVSGKEACILFSNLPQIAHKANPVELFKNVGSRVVTKRGREN